MRRGALAALLLALAAPAFGQSAAGAARPRDEIFKMVDAYIMSNLQESLGLTDEQFVKMLPLVKKYQTERRAFIQRRQATLAEIQRLLESGIATESRLAELMKELRTIESDEPQAVRRSRDAIDAQLSVVQQAKLRVLEARVEQRLRQVIDRARPQTPGERLRERANPPSP